MIDWSKRKTKSEITQKAIDDAREKEVAEAIAYLVSTDWQVMREHDTGELMSADIKTKRNAARVLASN